MTWLHSNYECTCENKNSCSLCLYSFTLPTLVRHHQRYDQKSNRFRKLGVQILLSFLLNTTQIWQEPQETNNTTYQTQIKRCCFTDPKAQLCIGAAFSHWSLDHHCTCNKANLTVWILISTRHHGSNSVIHHCYNVQVKLLKHEPQSVVECLRKREGALNTPKWAEKTAHISSLDGLS